MHDVHRNHKHKGIVDHIVPLSKDDTKAFDLDNLQTLHKSCHDGAKKEQDHRGYFIGFDANGMPIDKRHPWNLK